MQKDWGALPCFPGDKTGLIFVFTPIFTLGLIFGGCLILIYSIKKWSYKAKIKRFPTKQKLRKTIYIYLSLICFLFRNSLTTIYSKTDISSSSVWLVGHRFPKFQRSCIFAPTLSCWAIDVSWNEPNRAYMKIILKNQTMSYYLVGIIIRETRYETPYFPRHRHPPCWNGTAMKCVQYRNQNTSEEAMASSETNFLRFLLVLYTNFQIVWK